MIAAVLLRGTRNLNYKVKTTLKQLKLTRRYHAIVLEDTTTSKGMLSVAKHAIAWGEVGDALAKKLKEKGSPARLHPPTKRFGSVKRPYPAGMLGYWGKEIEVLLKSMVG
ncbi:uL30 family ribosomal protein [Candidatus Micrarchaeota archaeon]|nr:uL30 family ribosomal protein [Candidatus Micrarchaeota archaeon]